MAGAAPTVRSTSQGRSANYDTKIDNLPVTYQLNIKNLFDNVYYTSTTGSSLNVALGDSRRFSLSATVKF